MTISFVTPSARKASAFVKALRTGQYDKPDNDQFYEALGKAHQLHQKSFKERRELLCREIERLVAGITPELAAFIKVTAQPPSIALDREIHRVFVPLRRPDETVEQWRKRIGENRPKSPAEREKERMPEFIQVDQVRRKGGKLPHTWHPPMAYPTIVVTRSYPVRR